MFWMPQERQEKKIYYLTNIILTMHFLNHIYLKENIKYKLIYVSYLKTFDILILYTNQIFTITWSTLRATSTPIVLLKNDASNGFNG